MTLNKKGRTAALAVLSIPLASLLFSAAPSAGWAQTLELPALLEEARRNNPEISSIKEKIKAREASARAEGYLDDPSLKVELEDLSRIHPLNIAPGNAMLTRYTISQGFQFPGKLALRRRIAYKDVLGAKAELASKELEIEGRVKEAYLDYAFLNESIKKTGELKGIIGNISEIAQARYSTGLSTQQDVIKAQVESTMLANELITLDSGREIAAARLKAAAGRPQASEMENPGDLPRERVQFDTDRLIKAAVERNPGVKMAEFEAEANELNVELSRKNYYPDFMVGFAPIQRDGRLDSYDLMFQVNIPIWRGKYDNRTKEAASNALAMRSKVMAEKNVRGLEVKEAALQVEAADRMRTLYETGLLPQVEISFESALKNYQAGKIDFMTLLDTERELKKTRIDHLRTILEYRKRLATLERVSGTGLGPLESGNPPPGASLSREDGR